jgi:hypothetical protein
MVANRVLRASTDGKTTSIGAGMNIECLIAKVGNAMCAIELKMYLSNLTGVNS